MAKALSTDLRERVAAAVEGGMSRRQAAERFGVSPASAVRWCALKRRTGQVAPKPQGGDRRSGRVEAWSGRILAIVADEPDITLHELKDGLAREGLSVGIGTLWRFFDRRGITWKKKPRTRPSRIGRTS